MKRQPWKLISLVLVGILLLQGIGIGGWRLYTWQEGRAQAKQDTQAIEAFRARYGIATEASVSATKSQGVTLYAFQHQGKTILLLGNSWIELTQETSETK